MLAVWCCTVLYHAVLHCILCLLHDAVLYCIMQLNGTMFSPGDYAIAVRWLCRASEDSQLRTFELNKSKPKVVMNSTELRWSNIELNEVRPLRPAVRRSPRAGARAQGEGQQVMQQYKLPVETEQAILQECW